MEPLKSKGLFKKYVVRKADRSKVDPNAEYFVLRLDHYARDPFHVNACRRAVITYAKAIAFHLPKLSEDLLRKYGDRFEQFDASSLDTLRDQLEKHEKVVGFRHGSDEGTRFVSILNFYERQFTDRLTQQKELIEKIATHFIALKMVVETVGMAGTHAEKAARLRGLIELLDNSIVKIRNEQVDDLERHWHGMFSFGSRSEFPYRTILEKNEQLKRENEELKKRLQQQETTVEA